MARISLVTGGARSGKSAIAEGLALEAAARATGRATYIATSLAFDAEMEQRIALHRARRGAEWDLVEAPLDLAGALRDSDGAPCLVDCLTLWLTNLMMADRDWRMETPEVLEVLRARKAPVVLVTNEVGGGIVPENALARSFRDAAGLLNQQVGAMADDVILAVCGLPMKVK